VASLHRSPAAAVAKIVAARRARWIQTNTISSPFAQTHIPEPSAQHIQTWTDEAMAQLEKESAK
jgi:hypothetical protein